MAVQANKKTGYLRGCRGALLTVLNKDGSKPTSNIEAYWIDTSQEASIEATIVEGDEDNLRGGDHILVTLKEDDELTGVTINFTDARFDPKASTIMAGGKLITETTGESPDEVTTITGWDAPMLADNDSENRLPFMIEVYVSNYTSGGRKDGFTRITVPNCTGTMPNMSYSDQTWATEQFSIKGSESTILKIPTTRKEFVDALPPEATKPAG